MRGRKRGEGGRQAGSETRQTEKDTQRERQRGRDVERVYFGIVQHDMYNIKVLTLPQKHSLFC